MIVGLYKTLSEGEYCRRKRNYRHANGTKRAQLGIGYLPQGASIFRKLKGVEDNIKAVTWK